MAEMHATNWPATLEQYWSWHLIAACRELDSSVFFSPEGERGPAKERRERGAKEVCSGCLVREVCAAYALASHEPYGTWGGLTETERRVLWRRTDVATLQRQYRQALAALEGGQGPLPGAAVG